MLVCAGEVGPGHWSANRGVALLEVKWSDCDSINQSDSPANAAHLLRFDRNNTVHAKTVVTVNCRGQ